jgi:DNA-binding GntR family transcriptional regulator
MNLTTPLREAFPDVYSDLRARILRLDPPPGSHLARAELQQHYGLSSTPVRDALLRLQDEGLIEVRPQSRTLVSRIDLDQARQVQFLRSSVEQNIAQDLARVPNPRLLTTLKRIVHLQEEEAAQWDLPAFHALDESFHRTLFEEAGLLGNYRIIRRESAHIDRLRALHLPLKDKVVRILKEHSEIVDAISLGLPEQARRAMERHLSQTIAIGTELRERHPDYFKS